MTNSRLVAAERREDDAELSLRPQRLAEFIGQEKARANLSVFVEAARARKEALDHVLFVGPPGLGKTTLAQTRRADAIGRAHGCTPITAPPRTPSASKKKKTINSNHKPAPRNRRDTTNSHMIEKQ